MDLTGYQLVFSDEFDGIQVFPSNRWETMECYGPANHIFIKDGITWKAEMVKYKQD